MVTRPTTKARNSFLCCLMLSALSTALGQANPSASTQLEGDQQHLHAGSDLTFKLKLDGSVPEGPTVYLSIAMTQAPYQGFGFPGEVIDKQRNEYQFHVTLPVDTTPGEWHISQVSVNSTGIVRPVATNDVHFTVEGHSPDYPSKGTVTLQSERH